MNPISNAVFSIGSVVDINPRKITKDNREISIRDKQIKFARLKEKHGAQYLISQGIFDAEYYFEFIDAAELSIPIIPGIIPARLRLINQFGLPINTLKKQRLRAALTT